MRHVSFVLIVFAVEIVAVIILLGIDSAFPSLGYASSFVLVFGGLVAGWFVAIYAMKRWEAGKG